MEEQSVGWIAAILIGGVAGWLAELMTRSNMGILMIRMQEGWLSYLISGFVGACVLIIATRMFYPGRWRT
jgi:uncharacterized membrane protein YeaQ/YmgE (transglycosylase-associated protein family)